jgi:UDPglucose--hexose-1-phosphate uridylyltransferase
MQSITLAEHPHKRLNILTGEWILVSPHRTKRPWQGKVEKPEQDQLPAFDHSCYLCPGNKRADGTMNESNGGPYAFTNDFAALVPGTPPGETNIGGLLKATAEKGICRVISFSPRHDLTLPQLGIHDIRNVVDLWCDEFHSLAADPDIRYIQIFENKGAIMGCSNPHPHGQIWASASIPVEIEKESTRQQMHFEATGRTLLGDYLDIELQMNERIVAANEHFVALVPFWATWPYETMIISRRAVQWITEFTTEERQALADILKKLTCKYDNLFEVSFPYSAGIHQAPVNCGQYEAWHWHMHFYPPLLRSASIKKFMVGYELLANPQRDITAESAAEKLRSLPAIHYTQQSTVINH